MFVLLYFLLLNVQVEIFNVHSDDGSSSSTPGSSSYLFKVFALSQIDIEHCSYALCHE